MPSVAQERKIGRIERRADRNFIRQKFDKAMAQYETAIRREKDEDSQAALHLKTARLYFMVRNTVAPQNIMIKQWGCVRICSG